MMVTCFFKKLKKKIWWVTFIKLKQLSAVPVSGKSYQNCSGNLLEASVVIDFMKIIIRIFSLILLTW